jgi:hypothetical protein
MHFLSLILWICVLVVLLVTKKAGMCGWYTTKDDDPLSYYLFVALAICVIIFEILCIFDIINF